MKKVLVIGAATSGLAAAHLLLKLGYEVSLTDMKVVKEKAELEALGICVYDEGHPDCLKEVDWQFIVKNPGIPYHAPFVAYFKEKGVRILNEIEIAQWANPNLRFGAITGTNGKTTTTTLLGELLKAKDDKAIVAGNIGIALSEIVEKNPDLAADVALEISGHQLVAIDTFDPVVSVCMNLTPDHVDYFGSLDNYYKAKMLVYKHQSKDHYFLRNIDDATVMEYAKDIPCKVIDFSLKQKTDLYYDGKAVWYKDICLFKREDLHLPGNHNVENAMVASCMAYLMGVSLEDIQKVIYEFKGVEHRIEFSGEVKGVKYYNDSKGTNCDATNIALQAFEKPVILLAGGYDKKTGFKELIPNLHQVKTMYVFGATKMQLKEIYPDAVVCEDMKEAFDKASSNAIAGDVVLLSPACASWDQFPNFERRGEIFKEYVKNLSRN